MFYTGRGATVAIGTTATATNQATFEADTYQAVGEVENVDTLTRERPAIEFADLLTSRTRAKRGIENLTVFQFTYAFDGADTGQDAIETAYEAAPPAEEEYNFRFQLNDGSPGSPSSPTTIYMRGPVLKVEWQGVSNDNVIRKMAAVARVSDWVEVDRV